MWYVLKVEDRGLHILERMFECPKYNLFHFLANLADLVIQITLNRKPVSIPFLKFIYKTENWFALF